MTHDDLESKRALLVAQAELDRLKLVHAARDVRGSVRGPLTGVARAGRVMRALSLALAVWRFVRRLRGR